MLSFLRMHQSEQQNSQCRLAGRRRPIPFFSIALHLAMTVICGTAVAQTPSNSAVAAEPQPLIPLSLLCAAAAVILAITFLVLFNQKLQREVRERKKAEKRLRISEGEKAAVLDSMTEAVVFLDSDQRLIWANRAVRDKDPVSPNRSAQCHCFEILKENGVPCEGCPVKETLATGNPRESTVTDAGGRHWQVKVYPVRKEGGGIRGVVATHRDITESRRLQAEVLKNRKLESVGVLAGGIAHDFNNMLTAVMGYISLAELRETSKTDAQPFLHKAAEAATRAKHLASRLLTFSRGGHPIRQQVDVAHLLEEAVQGASRDYPVTVHTRLDLNAQWRHLWCDERQIRQAIDNVIVNACESMPAGGDLSVEAVCQTLEMGLHRILAPGIYLQISIRDRGAGIPVEIEDKIFDPYFTTKPMGAQKGAGLGLAITHSILQKHQGHVTVERRTGGGTCAHLFLPLIGGSDAGTGTQGICRSAARGPSGAPARMGHPKERILVLEDEPLVWETAKMLLSHLGHEVNHAPHGEAAIASYTAALGTDRPFTTVILDLTIKGGMGGWETLQALKRIDPEVRAFVSSGYDGDPVLTDYQRFGFSGVIAKPYNLQELEKALADSPAEDLPN